MYKRQGDDVEGMHPSRAWLAQNTNPRMVHGSLKEGIVDTDVFIGVSHGNILEPSDIAKMAPGAIVFALANPTPEVDPIAAAQYASIVATGRSDYPNQINNVLAFPGLFRGLLDAKVKEITTEVLRVAANAIADVISPDELSPNYIIPGVFHEAVPGAVSKAVRQAVHDLPTIDIPEMCIRDSLQCWRTVLVLSKPEIVASLSPIPYLAGLSASKIGECRSLLTLSSCAVARRSRSVSVNWALNDTR